MSTSSLDDDIIVIILHRDLGSQDEASSDEEQADKLLVYYPEDTPINTKLVKCNMLEGLIDFFDKFANDGDAIENVIMEEYNWSFCQCKNETNIWIIVGIRNEIQDNESLQCTSIGLLDAIIRMYRLYTLLHPNIQDSINGKDNLGWTYIQRVQFLRKVIRKQKQLIQQCDLDLETLRIRDIKNKQQQDIPSRDNEIEDNDENHDEIIEEETLGIKQGFKSIEEIEKEILTIKQNIESYEIELQSLLTNSSKYTPIPLSQSLSRFTRWFINARELNHSSMLQSIAGLHFLPIGSAAFQYLLQVRQSILESAKNVAIGSLILYDGQVIWSDVDDETTFLFSDFIRIQEMKFLSNTFNEQVFIKAEESNGQLETMTDLFPKGKSISTENDNSRFDQQWVSKMKIRRGIITQKWNQIDLEDEPVALSSDRLTRTSIEDYIIANEKGDDVTFDYTSNPYDIFCPRVYIKDNKKSDDLIYNCPMTCRDYIPSLQLGGVASCVGKALLYRQSRFIVVVFLDDWKDEDGPGFMTLVETPTLISPYNRFVGLCSIIQRGLSQDLEKLERYLDESLLTEVSNASNISNEMTSLPSSTSISSTSSLTRRPGAMLNQNIRLIYFNNCNRAIKTTNIFSSDIDPLLLFPLDLLSPFRQSSDISSSRKTAAFSSIASALSESALEIRPRCPLSMSLLTATMDKHLLRAINEVYAFISGKFTNGGGVGEICIRVKHGSKAYGGGIWVIGRVLMDRILILIIENKDTLNDMIDLVNQIVDGSLSQVII